MDSDEPVGVRFEGSSLSYPPQKDHYRSPRDGPLLKMSLNLLMTYKRINEVYRAANPDKRSVGSNPSSGSASFVTVSRPSREVSEIEGPQVGGTGSGTRNYGWDDENADYVLVQGEIFHGRYEVLYVVGKGSFGQVVRAHDRRTNMDVAIKVIKNKRAFFRQALIEIEILQNLNGKDCFDQYCVVRLLHQFTHRNHLCLVFELLSYNLYEFLRHTNFQGFSLNLVRDFGVQILYSLLFMSMRLVGPIVHCDLKPENILLKSPKSTHIKVIDFGSSCMLNQTMYRYIQSRFYRSPEVLLGIPYTNAIDVWSLGCILVELHTGEPLFSGQDEADQLRKICEVLGYPPDSMILESPKAKRFFSASKARKGYRFVMWMDGTPVVKRKDLGDLIGVRTGGPRRRFPHEKSYPAFLDVVTRMLDFNPRTRLTPKEALSHPFFRGYQPTFLRAREGPASRPPPLSEFELLQQLGQMRKSPPELISSAQQRERAGINSRVDPQRPSVVISSVATAAEPQSVRPVPPSLGAYSASFGESPILAARRKSVPGVMHFGGFAFS